MNKQHEDAALAVRAQGRDAAAETELFAKYRRLAFGWAMRRWRREDWAREVADVVVLELFKALPRYRPEEGGFRAWAWGVARLEMLAFGRKQGRRPETAVAPAALELIPAEYSVEQEFARREVLRAMALLPADEQAVVRKHFLEGRSNCELGRELSVSERTVRYRQGRAFERLREVLAPVLRILSCRVRPLAAEYGG